MLVVLLLPVTGAAVKNLDGIKTVEDEGSLQAAIDAIFAMYNRQYPDVFFLQLEGGNELIESIKTLKVVSCFIKMKLLAFKTHEERFYSGLSFKLN